MESERKLKRALKSGKDLEQYLPAFLQECASTNQMYAGMSFIIHYYNLYEAILDKEWTLENTNRDYKENADLNNLYRSFFTL